MRQPKALFTEEGRAKIAYIVTWSAPNGIPPSRAEIERRIVRLLGRIAVAVEKGEAQ